MKPVVYIRNSYCSALWDLKSSTLLKEKKQSVKLKYTVQYIVITEPAVGSSHVGFICAVISVV